MVSDVKKINYPLRKNMSEYGFSLARICTESKILLLYRDIYVITKCCAVPKQMLQDF